jgi:hypothetical protein
MEYYRIIYNRTKSSKLKVLTAETIKHTLHS